MPVNLGKYKEIETELQQQGVTLVAVSKTKPVADILELYRQGQLDFGENYVQELVEKRSALPEDIRWHFIGHLQSNKVKNIAPFVHLVQSVDSFKLLKEINKEALKHNRVIRCLLQVHIATEETKFGFSGAELSSLIQDSAYLQGGLLNIQVCGLMGMASFSDNASQVKKEFQILKEIFNEAVARGAFESGSPPVLSMGMSGDYQLAVREGSTLVRIGSLLFGERNYTAS